MTVPSRGARGRRAGRGQGWSLLTALLVLAIAASSTLVFTNRVELLRLAVILSLWAAVVAAFVTVIYRRQSDVAQARARDMKLVYDLQLDREISARREYELSVEAHLRRQLSREVRAQAADEMAALRSELASLRSHLEVMLGTDLAPRPALESERIAVPMPAAPGRVESSRVTVVTEEVVTIAAETDYANNDYANNDYATNDYGSNDYDDYAIESPIIDVFEEPLAPVHEPVAEEEPVTAPAPTPAREPEPSVPGAPWRPEPPVEKAAEQYVAPTPQRPEAPWRPPEVRLGRHSNGDAAQYPPRPEPIPVPVPPRGRHWVPAQEQPNPAGRHRGRMEPVFEEPVQQPPIQEPAGEEPADPQGQHADGQAFADLMQRLQVNRPAGGGGRRRRED